MGIENGKKKMPKIERRADRFDEPSIVELDYHFRRYLYGYEKSFLALKGTIEDILREKKKPPV